MSSPKVDAFEDPLPEGAIARLGTSRLQQGGVCSLSFSPDGTRLVSGGDLPLKVWNASTGQLLHELRVLFGAAFSTTFGKDEDEVFAVAKNGTIAHWTKLDQSSRWLSLGCAHGTLGFHAGKLVAADRGMLMKARSQYQWQASNPIEGFELLDLEDPAGFGGGRLAIGTDRGDVRVFDVPSGKLRSRIPAGAAPTAVAMSGSGATLAAGFADGRIGIFDVPSRRQVAEWPAHASAITALAFSPDGQTLASGSGARIRLWNAATGGERLSFPAFDEPPAHLSFRPDAPRIVTRAGATIQEWDADTGAELSSVPARGQWDDGSRIPESRFVVLQDGAEWASWDIVTGKQTFTVRHDGMIAVSSDGRRVFLASRESRGAQLRELPRGNEKWERDLPADFPQPTYARFLPGDSWILAGRTYERIWLFDANDGATERIFQGPVAVSRDGALIASSTGNGDDVPRGVDVFTPRDKGRRWISHRHLALGGSQPIRALAFAPFRRLLAISLGVQNVEVWDLDSPARKPFARFQGTEAHELVFSPDARKLATISWTSADVLVWELPA